MQASRRLLTLGIILGIGLAAGCQGGPSGKDAKGRSYEIKGKVTGDKVEEMKGKARQTVGRVKQTGKEAAYDAEHPAPEEPEDRV